MRCPTPAFRRPLRRGCKTPTEPRAAQAQEFQSVDLRRVPTWASRLLKPGCTAEAVKAVSRGGPLESPRQPQSPPPTPICRYRFGMRLTTGGCPPEAASPHLHWVEVLARPPPALMSQNENPFFLDSASSAAPCCSIKAEIDFSSLRMSAISCPLIASSSF